MNIRNRQNCDVIGRKYLNILEFSSPNVIIIILQIQGYLENFEDQCGGISEWITDVNDYYPSISEGWGVYSENPYLLEDLDILKDEDPLATYGVLKWQVRILFV